MFTTFRPRDHDDDDDDEESRRYTHDECLFPAWLLPRALPPPPSFSFTPLLRQHGAFVKEPTALAPATSTCALASSLSDFKETAYVSLCTTGQAVHPAPSQLTRSRDQALALFVSLPPPPPLSPSLTLCAFVSFSFLNTLLPTRAHTLLTPVSPLRLLRTNPSSFRVPRSSIRVRVARAPAVVRVWRLDHEMVAHVSLRLITK